MNNTAKTIVVIIALAIVAIVAANSLYINPVGRLTPCDSPSVVFSEFNEENNSGIYTTELLELTSEGNCGSRWQNIFIQLRDVEGQITNFSDNGRNLIVSYEGNANVSYEGNTTLISDHAIDIASRISNDTNGEIYPIRIIDNMTINDEDFITERYYDYDSDSMINTTYLSPKLSVGDKIMVYGSGSEANGPAREGWSLIIKHDYTLVTLSEINIS